MAPKNEARQRLRNFSARSRERATPNVGSRTAARMRPRAARDCWMSATVAARARIVHMRLAGDADKLRNRVEVGRRFALIARFPHEAVSVIGSSRCGLPARPSDTDRLPRYGLFGAVLGVPNRQCRTRNGWLRLCVSEKVCVFGLWAWLAGSRIEAFIALG
jgi:hypothetical protein